MVVRLHPKAWFVIALLGLALLVAGYALGRWQPSEEAAAPSAAEAQALQAQLAKKEQELAALKRRLAGVAVDAEVNSHVYIELREALAQQQFTIAGLREELSIYRGLVAGTSEKGLKIRSWQLYRVADREYRYRLVVQQRSAKERSAQATAVEGVAQVEIIGRSADGNERTIMLDALSRQHTQPHIELRFSHFQVIEGELALPEGFRPARVQVTVSTSKPQSGQVRKRYAWSVQERVDDVGKA